MHIFRILVFVALFIQVAAPAQELNVKYPETKDFEAIYKFLASPWMEGREAFERGGFLAADFISVMMHEYGLLPIGNFQNFKIPLAKRGSYFQDFNIISYRVSNASLFLIKTGPGAQSTIRFAPGLDFYITDYPYSLDSEGQLAFAGYGIVSSENAYDDYKGLDVKNKIVLVLDGFPGINDPGSIIGKKMKPFYSKRRQTLEDKIHAAKKNGAVGLIIVRPKGEETFGLDTESLLQLTMDQQVVLEDAYSDSEYMLEKDIFDTSVPSFWINQNTAMQLLTGTGIDLLEFERKAAQGISSSFLIKDRSVGFSVTVEKKPLLVRNVIGIIPGKDTSKSIVIGAHYDHLGKRTDDIYFGSDDNASGVSGLLALARKWSESGVRPEFNIVFASWTAEEKGLLGSRYFVESIGDDIASIKFYLNMDMISGSEIDDFNKERLSIGIRKQDNNLREMALKINANPDIRFVLDLWDVTGYSGSDYASFTKKNVPVMTFNSGLHDYYHTPGDYYQRADLVKMAKILRIVNESILNYLKSVSPK
jgi:hypothetical protein